MDEKYVELFCLKFNHARLDQHGRTPLFVAAWRGHLGVVRELLARAAVVDMADEYGTTPLHLASKIGHVVLVKELFARGASVDLADSYGATPLHLACKKGHIYVVKKLLAHGCTIDTPEKVYGDYPLHWAAKYGYLEVINVLIDHGAAINVVNKKGLTPLHYASYKGHLEVVHNLLKAGADLAIKCNEGQYARDVARQSVVKGFLAEKMDELPLPTETSSSVRKLLETESTLTSTMNSSNDDEATIIPEPSLDLYSIQSAMVAIYQALQDFPLTTSSTMVKTVSAILRLSLKFQTCRECIFATSLMVERIGRHILSHQDEFPNPQHICLLQDIQNYFHFTLDMTKSWKLIRFSPERQDDVQQIVNDVTQFQNRLRQAASPLKVNLNIQVEGNIQDLATDLANMMANMNVLSDCFE
ncbi:hypothetical protein LEN26_009428 [Aphanomyces euteiches]|nr:hypothetical protein AeMF1_010749 [Aphanomyces euteiches]KAH9126102.1 hypothetical protein LEN26_009428 [Aphanomyces euteiches]KAH9187053.1 hypothetical protein AeNC1_010975 [Aphanomyces euteiches]